MKRRSYLVRIIPAFLFFRELIVFAIPVTSIKVAEKMVFCKSRVLHIQKGPVTLAEFLNEDEIGQKLKPLFNKIIVVNSLKEGSRKIILSEQLSAFVRKAVDDLDLGLQNYQFSIPHEIEIRGGPIAIDEQEVRQLLMKQWKNLCQQNCRVDIKELNLPHITSRDSFTGRWNFYDAPSLPRGSFSIPIQAFFENQNSQSVIKKRYWINGVASLFRKVPVLQKNRKLGERLNQEDIKYEYQDRTFYPDASLLEEKQWLGRLLKWNKKIGQILVEDDLVKERTVMRGDWVKIIAREGELEVTTVGRAETEGGVGDRIRFQLGDKNNPHSVLNGVIQGKGEVLLQ